MVTGTLKKIADRFMRMTIHNFIKSTYFKKGTTPTVEQVLMDIDKKVLDTLLSQGYTEDEIKGMIEDTIRRHK